MSIERGEAEKAVFDEIIDEFASIKALKVLFLLACCSSRTRKGRIY